VAKLKGTYAEALPRLIHPQTGRIHTSYNQTVTATGRLSSSNPNLQNIPIRTEEGRKIRRAFMAAPEHVLLSADYSQIELRILAHYSQDERLLEAFREDQDIHRRTAAEVLNIPSHEVTPEMRRQAKAINFGIIYGMGPFGLAKQLRISNALAKTSIERYFDRYQGVKRFVEEVIRETKKNEYCKTLLGRKRPIPELGSRNRTVRQQGERLAVNTTIQGTAADLIKKAMIEIHSLLHEQGLKTSMLLQVHDELIFEAPMEELDQIKDMVKDRMENVWPISVPLKVDMGWGENWADAHMA
jgi:DNA polymerase-1